MDKLKNEMTKLVLAGKKSKNLAEKRMILNGVISEIILADVVAQNNKDLPALTSSLISTEFKEYVYKSRTLVLSRLIRKVESLSIKEIEMTFDKIISLITDTEQTTDIEKKAKGNSTLTSIENWKKVLNNDID